MKNYLERNKKIIEQVIKEVRKVLGNSDVSQFICEHLKTTNIIKSEFTKNEIVVKTDNSMFLLKFIPSIEKCKEIKISYIKEDVFKENITINFINGYNNDEIVIERTSIYDSESKKTVEAYRNNYLYYRDEIKEKHSEKNDIYQRIEQKINPNGEYVISYEFNDKNKKDSCEKKYYYGVSYPVLFNKKKRKVVYTKSLEDFVKEGISVSQNSFDYYNPYQKSKRKK